MDRFKLTVGNFEAIVDEKTEVTTVGNKISVTFNDYTTGKMTRLLTDSNIEMTTLDDVVDKEYIKEVRYHEKTFDKRSYFERTLLGLVNEFKKKITEKGEYEIVGADNKYYTVTIHYKDAYPKAYPLNKKQGE